MDTDPLLIPEVTNELPYSKRDLSQPRTSRNLDIKKSLSTTLKPSRSTIQLKPIPYTEKKRSPSKSLEKDLVTSKSPSIIDHSKLEEYKGANQQQKRRLSITTKLNSHRDNLSVIDSSHRGDL